MVSCAVYRNRSAALHCMCSRGLRRCDLSLLRASATSQLLAFGPGGRGQKGHSPLLNRRLYKLRARVHSCDVCVCKSIQFSCLRKDTRSQAAPSPPSATIAAAVPCIRGKRHVAAISSKCVNRMLRSHCASQKIDNERLAH